MKRTIKDGCGSVIKKGRIVRVERKFGGLHIGTIRKPYAYITRVPVYDVELFP